ncbi:MAG: CRISPR-associated endonuclease Cas2 [Spirochaetales bacterium]|jgi:CRISPR-associated protein Cas2|nr:CRISPR-associated endonuclease Cas2 [Exilispira sp.]NMC68268.1 CRISPR-associated endonuclease Cas2 [Spirochaetales bacterium]
MDFEENGKLISIDPFRNQDKISTKSEKWIVLYDIRDNKRLRKVAKIMENYGIRVQKSVFEIFASSDVIQRLRYRVQKVIMIDDYVLYINVCEEDWQKQIKYGVKACGYEQKDFQIL